MVSKRTSRSEGFNSRRIPADLHSSKIVDRLMRALACFGVLLIISTATTHARPDPRTEAAHKLLAAAKQDLELVRPEDKFVAQTELAEAYASLGDLNASQKAGLPMALDPPVAALIARGELDRAKERAGAIEVDAAESRAEAFLLTASALIRVGRQHEAIQFLREAFWKTDGSLILPSASTPEDVYRKVASSISHRLLELHDWDGAGQRGVNGNAIADAAITAGDTDAAAAAILNSAGFDETVPWDLETQRQLRVGLRVISALVADRKIAKAQLVCSTIAENVGGWLKHDEEADAPNLILMPLVDSAAASLGVESATKVAEVHRDERAKVEAYARSAVARRRLHDENGYQSLMRRAKAVAAQATHELYARRVVGRALVLAGDNAAADEYIRVSKQSNQFLGEEVAKIVETTEASMHLSNTDNVGAGASALSDDDLSAEVSAFQAGGNEADTFRKAGMISDQNNFARIYAYLHLLQVAPNSPRWQEVRAEWRNDVRAAKGEKDSMARMWRLSATCQLQVAVFGIGDPDAKESLEAIVGTELPTLAIDGGRVYKLDPLINNAFKIVEINDVFSQAARGEIVRGRPDRAELFWSKLRSGGVPSNPGDIAPREPADRAGLGREIMLAYIKKGDLVAAEAIAKRVTSIADHNFFDIALAWLARGNAQEAFRTGQMADFDERNKLMGRAICLRITEEGVDAALRMLDAVDDPRLRVSVLSSAVQELASSPTKN